MRDIKSTHTMNEISLDVTDASLTNTLKDMLNEALQGVHLQLEEIKQANATQFRQNFANNTARCKETETHVENRLKEMNETIKIQHRETRRRFERLEKKTNLRYFN